MAADHEHILRRRRERQDAALILEDDDAILRRAIGDPGVRGVGDRLLGQRGIRADGEERT
jgi:hypothetical protein